MGNENSQITFPIESNNHYNKVKANNKKIKNKEILFKHYENKDKKRKIQKIVKDYEIQRISTTPDRNVYIPGINKETLKECKRYGSCERDSRIIINEGINKGNIQKKRIKSKCFNSIFHITNLLNSIYSYGIDKEIGEFNSLNITKKQCSKNEGINGIFDATFKYNFFINNINKVKKKTNINKIRNKSPIMYDSVSKTKEVNEFRNSKSPNVYNKHDNENQNTHHKHKQNTTLILNEINMENEVISVNNKKKSNHNNQNEYLKNSNKKYSESRFISETESGFISSEEISLLNNMQKINKKVKEEDASESQTDPKQDTINHNLTNKNKINNKYFIDSQANKKSNNKNVIRNSINNNVYGNNINYNDLYNNNAIYNKQKGGDKNHDNLYNKNIVICSYDNMNNQNENDKEDEILLMNNESNKDDENNTYIEILKAMTEKTGKNKPENNYKNNNLNNDIPNKNKKINKVKYYPIKKQITPPNIPFKREITPKSQDTKENITPKNNTNRMILKTKKITPLKKLPININNIKYNTKNNIYNVNINTNLSPKEPSIKKSINASNNNNISPRKIFQKKIPDKSYNNSPIMTSYGNSIITKNKIHSEIASPSNSPEPSPLNNFNNNYKDRYVYKKMTKITNSIRRSKKINDNNKSNNNNINSINGNSNINLHGNNNNNLIKNSNIYNKVNNTNNTYNTNNYNNNTYFTNNTCIINNTNNHVNSTCVNNSKKIIRNSANKNKILLIKKERMSANSYNNIQNKKEIVEGPRTKSNDQKYPVYNSKNVLSSTKRKQK